jgi:hypothetical protein
MRVGELFVELGVTGADKAAKGLQSIQSGLKDIVTGVLTVTAELTGMLYAFNALAEASGNTGASLKKFENLTGISGETLQRWQWVMRQSKVSNDDTQKSFENLGLSLSKINLLEAHPKWLDFIIATTHIPTEHLKETLQNIPYMFQKMREFAQNSGIPETIRRAMLAEFGFSNDMIQALMTNKKNPLDAPKGLIRSEKEIDNLNRLSVAYDNFYAHLARVRDSFVQKYGDSILGSMKSGIDSLSSLLELLGRMHDIVGDSEFKLGILGILALFNPVGAAGLAGLYGLTKFSESLKLSKEDSKGFLRANGGEIESDFSKSARNKLQSLFGVPPQIAPAHTTNITQHIQGTNAEDIANKSHRLLQKHLNHANSVPNKSQVVAPE